MAELTKKISMAPLLAVNFVGTLGFSIVTPFLVVLVTNWGGNAVVYGLIAATYSFFQLFGAPILGKMSDNIGRRKVLLLSQAGTLASWGIFLVAFALPRTSIASFNNGLTGEFVLTLPLLVLFVARAADGLTGGNVSVANAYLADITPEADRSKNYGKMAVSTNLGFIVGPALAGLLGATVLGEILPVMSAFAISAVALGLIQFGLAETRPVTITEHLETPSACAVYGQENRRSYQVDCAVPEGLFGILRLPNMPSLMAVNFLVMMGFSFFYVAFPIHAVQALSWSVVNIGIFFAVLSLVMVVVQGPLLAWASVRYSDRLLMIVGGAILGLAFLLLMSPRVDMIYAAGTLIAVGNGLMWPTFMASLSKAAGKSMQGAVQGFSGSTGAVASIFGLIGGGIVYVRFGTSIFAIGAIVIWLAAILVMTYRPTTAVAD